MATRRQVACAPGLAGLAGLALTSALLAATALANAALFLSDDLNHLLENDPALRPLFAVAAGGLLLAVFEAEESLLTWTRGGGSLLGALARQLRRRAPVAVPLAALGIGLLQGTSYVMLMGDDYGRYWVIADALATGQGYPASPVGPTYQAGGMSPYLVDLPGLPLAMSLSFALLGHTVLAAMAPAVLASCLFAPLAYLALRELAGSDALALAGAAGLALFPLLGFYTVRAAEPDGMFLSALLLLAFLALRCDRRPDRLRDWVALGPAAALVALTRPEGLLYAGATFLTLALAHRARRGFRVASALAAAPLAAFSAAMLLTFGVPWPSSFAGTVGPEHVVQNLEGFVASALPRYAVSLGTPVPVLAILGLGLLALYAVGIWQLARSRPQLLFLALAPALGAIAFLLVSPALTRPQFPNDFFRRASYGLPFLALVASYPLASALRRLPGGRSGVAALSLGVLLSVLAVSYEAKLAARPEATYAGGTEVLTAETYLLATDLASHPYDLPRIPFERRGDLLVPAESFDYLAFRTDLNRFFAPMELHGIDRASGYAWASLVLFLIGLAYALVARTAPPRHQDTKVNR